MRHTHEGTVPEELRSLIHHLEDWVIQQRVMENALAACQASVTDHLARQLPDHERLINVEADKIKMRLISHSLVFQHGGLTGPHIMTELYLTVNETAEDENGTYRTNQSLGTFRYTTFLDSKSRDGFSYPHLFSADSEAAEKRRWANKTDDVRL